MGPGFNGRALSGKTDHSWKERKNNAAQELASHQRWCFLIVLALVFYFIMSANAASSTDPAELMRLTGSISGGAIGLSMAMIIIGLIGKKT